MAGRNVLPLPRLSNMLRDLLAVCEHVVQSRLNPRDGLREEGADAPFGFRTLRVLRHCASSDCGRVLSATFQQRCYGVLRMDAAVSLAC